MCVTRARILFVGHKVTFFFPFCKGFVCFFLKMYLRVRILQHVSAHKSGRVVREVPIAAWQGQRDALADDVAVF